MVYVFVKLGSSCYSQLISRSYFVVTPKAEQRPPIIPCAYSGSACFMMPKRCQKKRDTVSVQPACDGVPPVTYCSGVMIPR